jgi:hypothetical protein
VTRAKTEFHRRGVRCAVPLVALLLVVALGAGTAQAQRFFGVVNPFINRCAASQQTGDCLSDKDLTRMDRANLETVRWGFRWAVVQPTPGDHRWGPVDQVVGALADRGIRVLPVMTGTPPWAGPSYGTAPVQTRLARSSWRRFLEASVRRYGPGGDFWTDPSLYRRSHPGGPIEPITTWQIWNEQNLKEGAQHVTPGKYVRLMRISHDAIANADPKAKILLGGMPGYVRTKAWTYLNNLYRHHGFKHDFDAVAIHPYSGDVRHVFTQIKAMRRVMKRHGDRQASLWVTELGWGSKRPSPNEPINKGLQGQRQYLKFVLPLLRKYHKRWRISHVYWYRWRDPPPGTPGCTFCSSSGLFRHSEKPKPSWRAFKQLTNHR